MASKNFIKNLSEDANPKKKVSLRPLILLGSLLASYAVVYVTYRIFIANFDPESVMIVYMTLATALALAYVIYNRGLSRKNVTADMLPESWSEEKKNEFINDGKIRLKKSKPLLIAVLAFFFTFITEAIELIVVPFVIQLFSF
jgi:drug/metabolite transporter (DMT)-like permease